MSVCIYRMCVWIVTVQLLLLVQQIAQKSFTSGRKHENWYGYSFGAIFKKKHVSHLKIQDGGHFQDGRHFRYGYIILCNEIIPTTVL